MPLKSRSVSRKFFAIALLSLAVILLLLFLTELMLEKIIESERKKHRHDEMNEKHLLIHQKSNDPALGYELKPGAETVRNHILYKINSQGFRDKAPAPEAIASGKNIAVIGDSVAWGWDVAMESTWPKQLEAQLQLQDSHTQVINMAVNGYATAQEVRMLETRGLAYHPKLVILNYVLNDTVEFDNGLLPYYAEDHRILVLYVGQWVWHGVENWIVKTLGIKKDFPEGNPFDSMLLMHQAFFNTVIPSFEKLHQLSVEHHFKVLVVVTPVFSFAKGQPYPWQSIDDDVAALCRQNQFEYLDAQEYLKEYNSSEVSVDLLHPNALGHQVIAKAVAQKLEGMVY